MGDTSHVVLLKEYLSLDGDSNGEGSMNRFALWLALSIFSQVGFGLSTTVIDLQDLGRMAASNAPLLRALKFETDAAKEDAEGSDVLPNPTLSTQIGSLRSGTSSGITVESTLSQAIPFPGRLSRQRKVRDLEVKIRELSFEKAALMVDHESTLLGFRWAALDEETQHFRERKRRFQVIQNYLRSHPQASPVQKVESSLIQRQMQLIESEFAMLEEERRAIGLELQYLTASTVSVEIKPRWLSNSDIPNRSQFAKTVSENQQLRMLGLEKEHAESEVKLASRKSYPDFNLGLGYRIEDIAPANHFYYGSLNLTIPIFEHGQHSVPAAEARRMAKDAASQLFQSKLEFKKESAWAGVEAAAKILAQLPLSTAEDTDQQFENFEREFKKGRITIGLLLQADAQLHQTVTAVYDAQVNLAKRLSDLYLIHGKNFIWK